MLVKIAVGYCLIVVPTIITAGLLLRRHRERHGITDEQLEQNTWIARGVNEAERHAQDCWG